MSTDHRPERRGAVLAFYSEKVRLHLSDQNSLDIQKEEDVHEENEPEITDGGEMGTEREQAEGSEKEHAEEEAPAAPAANPPETTVARTAQASTPWKEDLNDFDESTIEVAFTLHPLKGRPAEERLVTFCIHNHSGPPVTNYYTQGELTNQSPLDRLLWAIAQEIRKFRAELSRRKQEQFTREEQARQTRREHKAASSARTGTTAAPQPSPTKPPAGDEMEQPSTPVATAASDAPAPSNPPAVPAPLRSSKVTKSAGKEDDLVQQLLF